jgi:hypothetical protein
MFDHSVPGLPAAAQEGLTPLQYMRKHGAFEVTRDVYSLNETPLPDHPGRASAGLLRGPGDLRRPLWFARVVRLRARRISCTRQLDLQAEAAPETAQEATAPSMSRMTCAATVCRTGEAGRRS